LPGGLNRKFEHVQHCREVCSQLLKNDRKQRRINMCLELWEKANEYPTLFSKIITGDKSWIYGYDPETKQQLLQWKRLQSSRV
jgi:hypothetical protein